MIMPAVKPGAFFAGGGNKEVLEQQLTTQANTIYEGMLDLNVSSATLASQWEKGMALRNQLLKMYGVRTEQAGLPRYAANGSGGAFPPSPAALMAMLSGLLSGGGGGAQESVDYKSKLQSLASKRAKRPLTKGELVYTVTGENAAYTATVSNPELLQEEYHSSAPALSKKAAEHAVAWVAIQAEFPGTFVDEGPRGGAADGGAPKRKAPDAAMDPKSKLMQYAQLLLGRPTTKSDIVYEVTPSGEGLSVMHTASVSIPEYDSQSVFTGEPASNPKQAQANAASAAVEALAGAVAPAEEERKAKRQRANKEALEKLKATKKMQTEAEENAETLQS